VLGQATLAEEFLEQAPDVDTLLVAVGGGGLLAGVATRCGGSVRLVGVEPVAAPTLTVALQAGHPVDAPADGVAADSLAPREIGALPFEIVKSVVHEVLLVTDDQIRTAQQCLWTAARVVAEPGGAAAFAALLSGTYRPRSGEHVGIVISGGNTTAVQLEPPSII
jgi:threonine dehydratase